MAFLDLDAALDSHEPLQVRLFGETWELPGEIPASVMLRFQRMRHRPDDDPVTDDEVMGLLGDAFGRDVLDAWVDRGVSMPRLQQAMRAVMDAWFGRATVEGDDAGEAPGPA